MNSEEIRKKTEAAIREAMRAGMPQHICDNLAIDLLLRGKSNAAINAILS